MSDFTVSPEMRAKLLARFGVELTEYVDVLTNGLLTLERPELDVSARVTLLDDLFRVVHNIKGTSGALDLRVLGRVAHALEDVFAALLKGAGAPSPALLSLCYRAVDIMQAAHALVTRGGSEPEGAAVLVIAQLAEAIAEMAASAGERSPSEPAAVASAVMRGLVEPVSSAPLIEAMPAPESVLPAGPALGEQGVRVSVERLDGVLAQLGELAQVGLRLRQRHAQVRVLQAQWTARAAGVQARATGDADWHDLAGETERALRGLVRSLADDTFEVRLLAESLEAEVGRLRHLPFSTITSTFGRMVRDLAHAAGKEVLWDIHGATVMFDRRILEQIKDPLMHLLRNAVDHGIELPGARVAAGKPRAGQIVLSAALVGREMEVRLSDDGAGVDLALLRQVAVARGMVEAEQWDSEQLLALLFTTGFSTRTEVSDVSGRGIGLDIVQKNVNLLGGRVALASQVGVGTTFTLSIPLTASTFAAMVFVVGGERVALALAHVERVMRVLVGDVLELEGRGAVRYGTGVVPVVHLADSLGWTRGAPDAAEHQVVIVRVGDQRMGYLVDDLLGMEELVHKPLGFPIVRVRGVAGAALLGDGAMALVLDAGDLLGLAGRASTSMQGARMPLLARVRQRHILVVDDSVTIRTLEKNILEASGYRVSTAVDGQEAWQWLAAGDLPDVILSDVAMPNLDGIGLAQRVKGEARTQAIPVILMTSLHSPEDRARGLAAGADAYLIKSEFNQDDLLSAIQQML